MSDPSLAHAYDCVCRDCHDSRHGIWAVIIPAPAPTRLVEV